MLTLTLALALLGIALAAPTQHNETSSNLGIIGGQDANINDFPWQVSLQYLGSHFCGGFLISNKWVVTAAHCIEEGYKTNLNVRVGTSTHARGGQSVSVKRNIVHPSYNVGGSLNNDIALLELASAVTLGTSIKAASLPEAGQVIPDNTDVTITGWGATVVNGYGSNTLKKVTVPSVNRNTCRSVYGQSSITNHMFCAGLLNVGGKDACQGDSGGPAVIGKQVVGIVSWGYSCAEPRYPGVYAKVSIFRNWIYQNTGI